jgi:two-component system chemotaxis sensor kinase CheA
VSIEAALQKGRAEPARLRGAVRSLHTLKGLSAMVGVDPIVEIAHELEAIVRVADTSTALLSLPALDLLLQGVRAIELRVAAFGARGPVEPAPRELLEALAAVQLGAAPARFQRGIELPASCSPSWGPRSACSSCRAPGGATNRSHRLCPSPEKTARGITITAVRERVDKLAEIVKVIPLALPKGERHEGGLAFVLLVMSNSELGALAEAAHVSSAELQFVDIKIGTPVAGVLRRAKMVSPMRGSTRRCGTGSIRVDVARLDDALEKLSE